MFLIISQFNKFCRASKITCPYKFPKVSFLKKLYNLFCYIFSNSKSYIFYWCISIVFIYLLIFVEIFAEVPADLDKIAPTRVEFYLDRLQLKSDISIFESPKFVKNSEFAGIPALSDGFVFTNSSTRMLNQSTAQRYWLASDSIFNLKSTNFFPLLEIEFEFGSNTFHIYSILDFLDICNYKSRAAHINVNSFSVVDVSKYFLSEALFKPTGFSLLDFFGLCLDKPSLFLSKAALDDFIKMIIAEFEVDLTYNPEIEIYKIEIWNTFSYGKSWLYFVEEINSFLFCENVKSSEQLLYELLKLLLFIKFEHSNVFESFFWINSPDSLYPKPLCFRQSVAYLLLWKVFQLIYHPDTSLELLNLFYLDESWKDVFVLFLQEVFEMWQIDEDELFNGWAIYEENIHTLLDVLYDLKRIGIAETGDFDFLKFMRMFIAQKYEYHRFHWYYRPWLYWVDTTNTFWLQQAVATLDDSNFFGLVFEKDLQYIYDRDLSNMVELAKFKTYFHSFLLPNVSK